MTDLVLGVSAYYHDSAAALVADGVPVAAAQEERFTRRRHDPSFPANAVRYCLQAAGASLDDVRAVAYYEDPRLKLRRVAAAFAAGSPGGFTGFRRAAPGWFGRKRNATGQVRAELAALGLGRPPAVQARRHHESHAASAFYPSPFTSAAVLCVDSVGEWATTSLWHGRGDRLEPLRELRFPHSLGLLYSAFTYFCGFKVDSGEYKLMGLAPYGTPRYADVIRERLIDVKDDGTFRLDVRQFEFLRGEVMTGAAFERLFDGPRRQPESPLTDRELDLAASVQQVTEDVMLRLARSARAITGESALCLAGGVALNCVANGRITDEKVFDDLWVQPAAGDAGGALGAALAVVADGPGLVRAHAGSAVDGVGSGDAMSGALLGPSFSDTEIRTYLDSVGARYTELEPDELARRVAVELADEKVVGWFQGRMEFGPRALGARSILGDPRSERMQTDMNLKIKFRESFRPFAPAVLAERCREYFDLDQPSPYMLLVAAVSDRQRVEPEPADPDVPAPWGLDLLKQTRSTIPAVTHVDHSARVQTVTAGRNAPFHRLLTEFDRLTGCPVLVNTSFNVRGEPIVHDPAQAYTCFMRTGIDVLAIGSFVLEKDKQPPWREESDWRTEIPLD